MTKNIKRDQKTPSLRFPGFSDSLSQKRLGDICEYKNGGSYEDRIVVNGKYNLITLNSIDIDGRIKNVHKKVGSADWYLEKDDLIMVLSDVAHGYFLGLVDIIPDSNKYVLNQRMGLLRKIDEKVNLQFLRSYINRHQPYFKLHGQGSSQQNLSKGDIQKFVVNMPSLPEQQKIASFLSTVDSWLDNLRSQKSSLESYKKSFMQKIFAQEIRFKDENGKDYPEWEEKSLRDILTYEQPNSYIVRSTEYSDLYKTPVLTAGKTFILGNTDENDGIFTNNLPVIIFDDFTTTSQYVDFPFKVKSSAIKILVAKKGQSIKFIYELLQTIKYQIGGHGRHWISKYSTINVFVPTTLEQEKIAQLINSIDMEIKSIYQQTYLVEKWKNGLIQRMFV